MRNLKKFLALVLAMMMVFSLVVTVSAAPPDVSTDDDYYTAITTLYSWKVLRGVNAAGEFKADGKFTRAEMAGIAYRMATGDVKDEQVGLYKQYASRDFTDLAGYDWALGYIGFCYNQGLVVGDGKGHFYPGMQVTGNMVSALMLRLLGYDAYGEFRGSNWEKQTESFATRVGITRGLKASVDMSKVVLRGEVAQMAYRTALSNQVLPGLLGDGTYVTNWNVADPQLIKPGSTSGAYTGKYSVWGDPYATNSTTTVTFNWVYNPAPVTISTEPSHPALAEFYDAITECDLAHLLNFDGVRYAISYTNGIQNQNLASYYRQSAFVNWNVTGTVVEIQSLDTVNKVSHEGRWSRVYANPDYKAALPDSATNPRYLIVGEDTFLGIVTGTWGELKDPAGHIIREAGASVNVFYNALSVNANSIPTYTTVNDTANVLTLTVTGSNYKVGDKLPLNIVTLPNENTMAAVGANTNYTDPRVGLQSRIGAYVEGTPAAMTPKQVTVNALLYDSIDGAGNNMIVGFKGTDGQEYFYNYTFSGKVLDGASLGQTYNVWLTPNQSTKATNDNTVLDYQLTSTSGGYGVIETAVVEQINSNSYVVKYTIRLNNGTAEGTTTTIQVVNPVTKLPFTTQLEAENYANATNAPIAGGAKAGTLVHYVSVGSYYYFPDQPNLIKPAGIATVASGRAEAIGKNYSNSTGNFVIGAGVGTYGALVNNATVFFVAEYMPDTTTPQAINSNDYVFTRYHIYQGFQNIPDLTFEANSEYPANTTITALDIQAFDVDASGNVIPAAVGQYAKYVVVNLATKQTMPPASVPTLNYAFIVANDVMVEEYNGYYMFPAYINGTWQKLQVALNAGKDIQKNGLYSIDNFINGQGYSSVTLMNGADNNAGAGFVAPYAGLNMELKGSAAFRYFEGVICDGVNYYTVTETCPVYLINPTHGGLSNLSQGALNVYCGTPNMYGQYADMWYQLDAYGRICTIYVLDINTTGT